MPIDKAFNDASWKIIPGWICAAAKSDMPALQKFLDEGMKVDAQDINGTTALMVAVREGHMEVVDFLLAKGADVGVRDRFGWTALDVAAGKGNLPLCEKLVAAGAKADSANDCNACFMKRNGQPWKYGLNLGVTTLMVAAENGHTFVANMLLVNNAKINAADKWGCTALIKAAKNGHLETARFLLDSGADANAQQTNGWNALREAAWMGRTDMVALLLGKTDVTKGSTAKETGWASLREAKTPAPALDDALVAATGGQGTADIVRMLLEKGGNVNARHDADGASLLFMAARRGDKEIVKLLLDKGADPEIQNFHRLSAIGLGGDPEISKMIKDAVEAKKTPPVAPPPAPQPPSAG